MYPILYSQIDTVGTVPSHNGLGLLTDCLKCMVEEERNGSYELTLKYPVTGIHAKEFKERRIIKAKPNYTDDPQLFRIYSISKVINDTITVKARHISYDLSGYTITSGTASNAVLACNLLQQKASGWSITTDKNVIATFKITEPSSVRSWFGGKEGSFLDIFGTAEWKYDNFSCSFLEHRGTNRGVTVKYSKNLLTLNQDIDSSNIITGVLAFWKDSQDDTVIVGDTISTSVSIDVPNVYTLDCSSDFENPPTKTQLNNQAQKYIDEHENAIAKQNIKLNFLQLGLLKDRVDLCDTITIEYADFGITGLAKCIVATWDVLKDRYDSIEIGEPKTNISDTIVSLEKKDTNKITPTEMSGAISRATALITGNSGGYVVLHDSNGDELPDELLIMNTPDISTATKVWRWNLSGLGYSKTGYDGSYGLAMTMEGEIDCSFLKTGTLVFGGTVGNTNGSLTIKDQNNNVIANFNKSGCTVKGNIYADSFVADAGSDVEIHIGNLPAEGSGTSDYTASNGIYIFDENRTGGNLKPVVDLSNTDGYIETPTEPIPSVIPTRVAQLILGDLYNSNIRRLVEIRAGYGTSKIQLNGGYNNLTMNGIELEAYYGEHNGFGKIVVTSDGDEGSLYYNGGYPEKILLGPMKLINGILQPHKPTSGNFRGIQLQGNSSNNNSFIDLYDSSGNVKGRFQVINGYGILSLWDSNNKNSINLNANNHAIGLDNNNNIETITLSGDNSSHGGSILLRDSNNKGRVGIWGNDGVIALSDGSSSNKNRIYLDGAIGKVYVQDSGGTNRGELGVDSSGNGTFYLYKSNASTSNIGMSGSNGNITCVSLTQTSTKKVKKNIKELSDTEAQKILDITPVTYDFKDKDYGKDKRGFIAEDVDKVLPNIVTKDEDNNPLGINYTEIIPYLTKMIQMQQKQINDLETRVKELEKGVNDGKAKS